MRKEALNNVAYSKEYREELQQYKTLFLEENKKDSEDIILTERYKITKTNYAGQGGVWNMHGHICVLSDKEDNIIHSWKCFDNDADFEKFITHQNDNDYLIYRQDLYGYTVFDLINKKEFQYYPQCVLDGYEYFIWTDVHYNPLNNLLAVTGCIWAAPWSTLLVDFSNPLDTPKFQIDIINCLPGDYDVYDDADFVRWDGDNLVLNCYNAKTNLKEEVILPPEAYFQRINNL